MKAILDTGPWVALIDRSEAKHRETVNWFQNFSGNLYTTEAVLTEVLYLLNFSINAQSAAIDFVLEKAFEIIPMDPASLQKSKHLMQKHSDLPMDFADATLLCLAMDTGIQNIVTFDRKDFSIYRTPANHSFNILP